MRHQFKGNLCVYCSSVQATTADHIFARQFFPVSKRNPNGQGLPQVPACSDCNGAKAKLEHYLTAVLPFSGEHADSLSCLEMVEPRLNQNSRLKRHLSSGSTSVVRKQTDGAAAIVTTLPVDGEKINHLFQYFARGLLWHHWKVTLTSNQDARARSFTRFGQPLFEAFALNLRSNYRASANIGDGAFVYEGTRADDNPSISVWQFRQFGGGVMQADSENPQEDITHVGVITGNRDFLDRVNF
jgi:hypothetical protein